MLCSFCSSFSLLFLVIEFRGLIHASFNYTSFPALPCGLLSSHFFISCQLVGPFGYIPCWSHYILISSYYELSCKSISFVFEMIELYFVLCFWKGCAMKRSHIYHFWVNSFIKTLRLYMQRWPDIWFDSIYFTHSSRPLSEEVLRRSTLPLTLLSEF